MFDSQESGVDSTFLHCLPIRAYLEKVVSEALRKAIVEMELEMEHAKEEVE